MTVKRERPPMPPLAVRVTVAERQFKQRFPAGMLLSFEAIRNRFGVPHTLANRLRAVLGALFEARPIALDHDPALILRPYNPRIKDVAARYTPHAHDPDALIYREKADHQQKTTGRRPGASRTITTKGSDIGLKTKFARLEKPQNAKKRPGFSTSRKTAKQTIPSRPFPKGRKFS